MSIQSHEREISHLSQQLEIVSQTFQHAEKTLIEFRERMQHVEDWLKKSIFFKTPRVKQARKAKTDGCRLNPSELFGQDELSSPVQVLQQDDDELLHLQNVVRKDRSILLIQDLCFSLPDVASVQFEPSALKWIPLDTLFVQGIPLVALRRERFVNLYDLPLDLGGKTDSGNTNLYFGLHEPLWLDSHRTMHLSFADLVGMNWIRQDRLDWSLDAKRSSSTETEGILSVEHQYKVLNLNGTAMDRNANILSSEFFVQGKFGNVLNRQGLNQFFAISPQQDLFGRRKGEREEERVDFTERDVSLLTDILRSKRQRREQQLDEDQWKKEYPSEAAQNLLLVEKLSAQQGLPKANENVQVVLRVKEYDQTIKPSTQTIVSVFPGNVTNAVLSLSSTMKYNENIITIIDQSNGLDIKQHLRNPQFPQTQEDHLLTVSTLYDSLSSDQANVVFHNSELKKSKLIISCPNVRIYKDGAGNIIEAFNVHVLTTILLPLTEGEKKNPSVNEFLTIMLYRCLSFAAVMQMKHIIMAPFGLEAGYSLDEIIDRTNHLLSRFSNQFETITIAVTDEQLKTVLEKRISSVPVAEPEEKEVKQSIPSAPPSSDVSATEDEQPFIPTAPPMDTESLSATSVPEAPPMADVLQLDPNTGNLEMKTQNLQSTQPAQPTGTSEKSLSEQLASVKLKSTKTPIGEPAGEPTSEPAAKPKTMLEELEQKLKKGVKLTPSSEQTPLKPVEPGPEDIMKQIKKGVPLRHIEPPVETKTKKVTSGYGSLLESSLGSAFQQIASKRKAIQHEDEDEDEDWDPHAGATDSLQDLDPYVEQVQYIDKALQKIQELNQELKELDDNPLPSAGLQALSVLETRKQYVTDIKTTSLKLPCWLNELIAENSLVFKKIVHPEYECQDKCDC